MEAISKPKERVPLAKPQAKPKPKHRRDSHSSEIEEEIAEELPHDDDNLSRKSNDSSIVDEVGSNRFGASGSESQIKDVIKEEISIKSSF